MADSSLLNFCCHCFNMAQYEFLSPMSFPIIQLIFSIPGMMLILGKPEKLILLILSSSFDAGIKSIGV